MLLIPFTVDEMITSVQFLKASVLQGKPFSRTFWVGGTLRARKTRDTRTPHYGAPDASLKRRHGRRGTVESPRQCGDWHLADVCAFNTVGRTADNDHLFGALVRTVAVIVMAEVIRAGRFLNVLFGAWIIAAPWLLTGHFDWREME